MENEQVEQVETMKTTKNLWGSEGPYGTQLCGATPVPQGPLTSSKSEGPMSPTTTGRDEASGVTGSFIGMGMVGFCFGTGLILAVKTVNNLEELIRR